MSPGSNTTHFLVSAGTWEYSISYSTPLFSGGKWFLYTAELFLNTKGNYCVIHISPILILLFPMYAVFPRVQTLLFMKCLVLSLAALPLFHLSRETKRTLVRHIPGHILVEPIG